MSDLWKFDLGTGVWVLLSGNRTADSCADYGVPYPGGVIAFVMALDSADRYLYVFGGQGFDEVENGICEVVC